MFKVAIIGTGIIGLSHLEAIARTKACQLCAVCDVNEEKAKAAAERYQVPYFTDYREIPEKTEADVVIVNLPHFLHCECTVFFLEQGLHVLVEKPMANTVEECDRMIEASERSGKILMVGHVQRFFKAGLFVKEAIADGRYGKLCMITGTRSADYFLDSRPRWFLNKKAAGGGIGMNFGAHALDTLFYMTGERNPEVVSGYDNLKNGEEIEGHMQFFLKFVSGLTMCQTLSGYNRSPFETIYYFTDAVVKIEGAHTVSVFRDGVWEEMKLEEDHRILDRQLVEFVKCLEGKPGMVCTAQEGRDVVAVLEKIYQKNQGGTA